MDQKSIDKCYGCIESRIRINFEEVTMVYRKYHVLFKVHMSQLILIIVLLIPLLTAICSCSDGSDSANDGLFSKELTPDEWLQKYNAAWIECSNEVPSPVSQDIRIASQEWAQRDIEIDAMMKKKHKRLYSYLDKPEYLKLLQRQRQQVYQSFYDQNQRQLEIMEEHNKQQEKRNQQEIEHQKAISRMFTDD